jgi:hypothetical protein
MTSNDDNKITNTDLYNKKYSVDELEKNVFHLNRKILLLTQTLTAEFCVKHIFEIDIESGSEDSYLFDKNYILERQTHITDEEFYAAYKLYYTE